MVLISHLGVVQEDKVVYFPPGTMYEIALKTSDKKELRDVYQLHKKYSGYLNMSGQKTEGTEKATAKPLFKKWAMPGLFLFIFVLFSTQ